MSQYKQRQLRESEEVRRTAMAQLAIALDEGRAPEERIRAFGQIGGSVDAATYDKIMGVVYSSDGHSGVRAAALGALAGAIGLHEGRIHGVIDLATDQAVPGEVRQIAIRLLQASSFTSRKFPGQRPAYVGALRTLIDDDDPLVSQVAIEYLALNKDEYVQRRLVEGLTAPERELVEPELGVQFLAYDLHADHFAVLRKLVRQPPNEETRVAALRNLAADPDSVELMKQTMDDRAERAEVRHIAAVALSRLAPGDMESRSDRIVADAGEDEDLKVALLNSRMHMPGADSQALARRLERVAQEAESDETKEAVRKLSSRVRNTEEGG